MKARQGSVYCNNIIIITDPKIKAESSLTVFTMCKTEISMLCAMFSKY